MNFKKGLNKIKGLASARTLTGKELVNYESMDSYTKELMTYYNGVTDNKQDKTDNSLNTTDKTVAGAINELKKEKLSVVEGIATIDDSYAQFSLISRRFNKGIGMFADKGAPQIVTSIDGVERYLRFEGDEIVYSSGALWTNGNCPISKGERGYARLKNGLLIQWGYAKGTNTVYYPVAFSLVHPVTVVSSMFDYGKGGIDPSSRTASSFKCSGFTEWYYWIAIGY